MALIIERLTDGRNILHCITGPISVTRHVEKLKGKRGKYNGNTREIALISPGCDEKGDDTAVRRQVQQLHGVPVTAIIANDLGTVNGETDVKILPDSVVMTMLVMNFKFLLPDYPRLPTKIMQVPIAG